MRELAFNSEWLLLLTSPWEPTDSDSSLAWSRSAKHSRVTLPARNMRSYSSKSKPINLTLGMRGIWIYWLIRAS